MIRDGQKSSGNGGSLWDNFLQNLGSEEDEGEGDHEGNYGGINDICTCHEQWQHVRGLLLAQSCTFLSFHEGFVRIIDRHTMQQQQATNHHGSAHVREYGFSLELEVKGEASHKTIQCQTKIILIRIEGRKEGRAEEEVFRVSLKKPKITAKLDRAWADNFRISSTRKSRNDTPASPTPSPHHDRDPCFMIAR
ncbi:hypothetical protein M0802_012304 [Mischocyttarus mexicanus]|nr:hypothetical protein M0802_012304 [Mischocyttarus mexicanus]